jgi:hypothetical protein
MTTMADKRLTAQELERIIRAATAEKLERARAAGSLTEVLAWRRLRRRRGRKPTVHTPLIGVLRASGWKGEALIAELCRRTGVCERTAYRALKKWRDH